MHCMTLVSSGLFRKNLGNLREFFGQMVHCPPWQKIAGTPMLLSLSTPEILPVKSPHAFGFPIVNTPPFLRNSSSKNPPPSPSEISPKSRPWYRYGYFLESPICIVLNRPVSCQSSPKFHTNHSNSEIASPKSIQSL